MKKASLLACALLISLALLFLPSTEARALLQSDPGKPGCGRGAPGGRYTPCRPAKKAPPKCSPYERHCHSTVSPTGP
ncbi:uncharacterized protein J3R85_016181 [Psidium guajava]|nr:uncharacterized protein J3R85_016181 [Psidium guajava]